MRGSAVPIGTGGACGPGDRAGTSSRHNAGVSLPRPGKPTDDALVGSLKGRLRGGCLNANRFLSLAGARSEIETWRRQCDESRPHAGLG